ncbi:hypothetical protein ACP70R_003137 [Stipagrostis hirtigluma subsp. patula]
MAAESERTRTRTSSTCTAVVARGTHSFKIAGYSLYKGLGIGKNVRSSTFAVGGHEWFICYYPAGKDEECKEYVAVFLNLVGKPVEVRMVYDFRLVNPATGLSSFVFSSPKVSVFDSEYQSWGTKKFMKKSVLEGSPYLRDDCLVIQCDATVIKELELHAVANIDVQVPPSDLLDNLGKLLESEEQADVTFKVGEETFHAHKLVLAMRSPVFKAQLYGPLKEEGRQNITVEDMEPRVFRALLHFIYRDSLPAMDDLDADENEEIVKHLLVAADRYAMERMKLMCESILCKRLDFENVAATLAFADQHHCSKLKDGCIQFLKSSNRIEDVLASQGYKHLKRACPAVTTEIWETVLKCRKI